MVSSHVRYEMHLLCVTTCSSPGQINFAAAAVARATDWPGGYTRTTWVVVELATPVVAYNNSLPWPVRDKVHIVPSIPNGPAQKYSSYKLKQKRIHCFDTKFPQELREGNAPVRHLCTAAPTMPAQWLFSEQTGRRHWPSGRLTWRLRPSRTPFGGT